MGNSKKLMEINEKLLKDIRNEFENVHNDENIKSREDWSNAFFDALTKIGLKEEHRIYSSSKSDQFKNNIDVEGEWLFDLCWSYEERGNIDGWKIGYKGLRLICESEWSQELEDILYDFQKLAVAKAEIKIMIVQYTGIKKFEDIKSEIEKSLDKSLCDKKSIYILAGSGNGPDDIELKWVKLKFK